MGWSSNFVGSESGQIQNMVSNRTQRPSPPPNHTLSVNTVEDRIVVKYNLVSYICLANYGANEAIYLCNGVVKIHQYFRPKMRQYL